MLVSGDGDSLRISVGTDTRADSLLVGCFAGVLLCSRLLPPHAWLARLLNVSAIASVIGLIYLSTCFTGSSWMIYIGWLLASVCAMIIIIHLVSTSDSLLHRVLGNPLLTGIGKISYGIYLWHFPILSAMQQHQIPGQKLACLLPVLAIVLASYYFIERPCLKLKTRFQRAEP